MLTNEEKIFMEENGTKTFSLAKRLAFTAVFAALCCVSTIAITIPLPASGYFNVGDVFVLLAGWLLGGAYGCVAAALGSALADIVLGAPIYAPATFLIKGVVAFLAYLPTSFLKKRVKNQVGNNLAHGGFALLAESVMVLGYFLYECILTNATAAFPNIFGNALQGLCFAVLATAILTPLQTIPSLKKFFPTL